MLGSFELVFATASLCLGLFIIGMASTGRTVEPVLVLMALAYFGLPTFAAARHVLQGRIGWRWGLVVIALVQIVIGVFSFAAPVFFAAVPTVLAALCALGAEVDRNATCRDV